MIIKEINLQNWMCFRGKQKLENLPSGAISICASYSDNPRRSNWGGKSAFLEAIEWCLYGVHRKRLEDEIIYNGAKETSVTLIFDDGMEVVRSRIKGKSTKLAVHIKNDTYKQKDAQNIIEKLLGFDQQDYRATVNFAQGDTSSIVEKTNSQRRSILDTWLGMDMWSRIHARAKVHLETLEKDLESYSLVLSESDLEILNSDSESLEEEIAGLKTSEDKKHENIKRLEEEISEATKSIALQTTRDTIEKTQKEISEVREELSKLKILPVSEHKDNLSLIERDIYTKSTRLAELTKILDSGFQGICPLVKEACPSCDFVNSKVDSMNSEQENLKTELGVLKKEKAFLSRKLGDIELNNGKASSLKTKLENLESKLQDLQKTFIVEEVYEEEQLKTLKEKLGEERKELTDIGQEIRDLSKILSDKEKLVEKIEENNKAKLEVEESLKIAKIANQVLSPLGLPLLIRESLFKELEENVNLLLDGTDLDVEFSWCRETKKLSDSCVGCGYMYRGQADKQCPACNIERAKKLSDEVEILVSDGSNVIEDVKYKSGGAKVLVGSAIRFAASRILKSNRDSLCEWSQIDEPFGPLDVHNRKDLANTFANMLEVVGIRQSFVVSHDSNILDSLPGRIEIMRHNGYSEIKNACS